MKLKREKVIELISQEIQRRFDAERDSYLERRQKFLNARDSFVADNARGWLELKDTLQKILLNDAPLTRDLIPDSVMDPRYRERLKIWDDTEPVLGEPYLGDLPAMRELLSSSLDEEVSTAELTRLGFKVPSIFSNLPKETIGD